MQRFRFLSAVLASGLICGAFLAQADPDTPAQAAARAALQQQMNQSGAEQPPVATNSTTLPATTEPTTPPATPPPAITVPTPQFSTNIPMNISTNVPASNEMESDLAAMPTNQPATAQMKTQPGGAPLNAPPPSVLNTNETEQYPVNPAMAPLPPPPTSDATSTTPPSAAMTAQPVAVPPGGPGSQPLPAAAAGPGPSLQGEQKTTNSSPNFETISAPPLPISPEKQSELQSLLSQYMSNKITPGQYQEERAKIMAEQ